MQIKYDEGLKPGKTITFNYDEVEKEIELYLKRYVDAQATELTLSKSKNDRASINKIIKSLKEEITSVKKILLEPMGGFEQQIKCLIGKCETVSRRIDDSIKNIEAIEARTKLEKIWDYFSKKIVETFGSDDSVSKSVAWRIWMDDNTRWTNTTYKIQDIFTEIDNKIQSVLNDYTSLISRYTDISISKKAEIEFVKTLDLNNTLRLVDDYIREQEVLNNEKVKIEQSANQIKNPTVDPSANSTPPPINDNTMYELTIKFYGNLQQMNGLRSYIDKNGIAYEQITKLQIKKL